MCLFNVTVTSPKPRDDWLVGSIQVISRVIAGGNPPFASTLEYSASGKGGTVETHRQRIEIDNIYMDCTR
jgi:hypothetical protein